MSSVQRATKLLKVKPYKNPVVHALHQQDPNKRLRFFKWVLEKVNSGELDAKEIFLATRLSSIYMDRCVHKITGITVTEKRSDCLRAVLTPREAAGRPDKAASDSNLLRRVIYE